jgi:amino acid adenylation domain-containing protein
MKNRDTSDLLNGVAIIGMAGRFPGARNVEEFWRNQCGGVEAISRFGIDELEIPTTAEMARQPNFVPARSVLDGVDLFDAAFFGIYPKEAELMDPQHRVFLECCWEAIEEAGYDPLNCQDLTGVFAGCSASTYFLRNVCSDRGFIEEYVGGYQVTGYPYLLGSNLDFLATRVAYKLNLKGPAFTLLAGCSTSLLAVCQAAQALQAFQCDMALAGGVSITFPQKRGYLYQEGGMVSPDGHCRAFDESANGTVFGSGSGVVLLKRVEDALADGDHIYAVIRGYAINNDGASKVGYTAPSVEGQARVIAMAHAAAGVEPETITYLEAHGTGTPLGDPIEVAALTQAFRAKTQARHFCALGTAKANVGHLDIAAGVTGLIHAVQAIRHGMLPPTLHFERPNPKLNLETSPFFVNTRLSGWNPEDVPRRAGVSAFGVGGTNAHVVLEEAPEAPASSEDRAPQLLLLSAKSPEALGEASANLAGHLAANPGLALADVAYTLQTGRHHFEHRRSVVASTTADATELLIASKAQPPSHQLRDPFVGFLFPGQGVQYPGMGQGLYRQSPVFRSAVDRCAAILQPHLGFDLRTVLYPADPSSPDAAQQLTRTECAQSAIFTVEYALAQLWLSWGIEPRAMIGHSIGEFVAACLAGVFSLEDALRLVAARGRMMQAMPAGAMLSVRLPESEIAALLDDRVSLASSNSPGLHVLSGPIEAIDALEQRLTGQGAACRRLVTSHAFHSAMMDPAVGPFTDIVREVKLSPPRIPYVSTLTGTWITPEEAVDPTYWGSHLRRTVRFSQAVRTLLKTPELVLLETGPGTTLNTLARQHATKPGEPAIVSSLPGVSPSNSDYASVLAALGSLWLAGVQPDWSKFHGGRTHSRISLPTYPFQRKRYWVEPPALSPDKSDVRDIDNSAAVLRPASKGLEPQNLSVQKISPGVLLPEPKMECQMLKPTTSAPPPATRCIRLRATLTEIIEELSGADLSDTEPGTSFLDMGFDSLFLTQVTQAIQNRFHIKITFRQLLDRESTLDALASFLDGKLPPDVLAAEPAPVAAPIATPAPVLAPALSMALPASAGNPLAADVAERIVREQLQAMTQLMAQQLQMLRGGAAPPPAAAPASAPAPAPAATKPVAAPAPEPSPAADFKPAGRFKPVQSGKLGGLTDQQEQHLAALVERYARRTASSKRMTQEHRSVLADPRVVSGFRAQWKEIIYPIVSVRSRGSRLWDVDGNEYVDLVNGFGPIALGHLPEFVAEAVRHQLEEGIETGPQSPLAGKTAQLVCDLTGMERATFCNTGSEAVMAALRMARTVTGRKKIVMFAGAYHGTFDEVLVKGVRSKSGALRSVPVAPGIPQEKVDNVYVLDYGTPESLEFIRAHAEELAAVLVEPVQSRNPALQPVDFLREVRAITQASETALIIDEVVTGFRAHPGGVQALWKIRADLATYGKVLGGGMPIGVVAGSAKFMDALDGGPWSFGDDSTPDVGMTFFAGTFVRHPLALAACHSVLSYLKEQGPALQEDLNRRTGALAARLNKLFRENEVPAAVEHFSSFFYFHFPADQRFGSLLYFYLRERGIHILEGFPCFLTTAHSDADFEKIYHAFEESVHEMQEAGFFPAPAGRVDVPQTPREAPMTEPQKEIWLAAHIDDEVSCAYNESFSLRFQGTFDEGALRDALNEIVARHEALRACVCPDGEHLRIEPKLELPLPLTDLSGQSPEDRDAAYQRLLAQDARTPFDLTTGPLVRACLVRMAAASHILVFTAHHLVCDGWSANVILDELSQLYSSRRRGQALTLPLPLDFSEYAAAEARKTSSPEHAEVEAYWLSQFQDVPPLLALPLDRPRPPVKTFTGATCRRTISAQNAKTIKTMGAQNGCTLFVTLLAGFHTLLHRLSNQEQVVLGVPTAGQSLIEDVTLVGHCVNFLPLRAKFPKDLTFAHFLKDAKKTLLDAYDHQSYTYGTLIRKLGIKRDPTRLPLMEVQFNVERVGDGLKFEGLEAEVEPNPKSAVNFDLFFNVIESSRGLTIDCDYNTTLFDEATIARWIHHFETLLLAAAADVSQPLDLLPLLTPEETSAITQGWNATHTDYPSEATIHRLFEIEAARNPGAVALRLGGERMTYGELNRRANQLAHLLVSLGVGPDVLVGCAFERSFDLMIALLGVLKAGGAYVPLDPAYPKELLAWMAEDARATVLLTQPHLTGNLPSGARIVTTTDPLLDGQPDTDPTMDGRPSDLAYVIYTSGSTGRPKGVMVEHHSVVRLVRETNYVSVRTEDVFLQLASPSFDAATFEIWGALLNGSCLGIMAPGLPSLDDIGKTIREYGVTTLWLTAGLFHRIVDERPEELLQVRQLLAGGDVLSPAHVGRLLQHPNAPRLINGYGPTEGTTFTCCHTITSADAGRESIPIGKPIANTRVYIVDERMRPVPIGVPGELLIAGDGLARGYWNRSDLTAEKFVAWAGDPGNRVYRSGDLARYGNDGTIQFLGRIDRQLKLRGFRIEPGEIETVLSKHPSLKQAVVVLREDTPGDKRLVAYCVPASAGASAPPDLRPFASAQLPDYMVPSAFVMMERLPLTSNGKVDQAALPAPDPKPVAEAYVAPRSKDEETLAQIWAEVLHLKRVGVTDNLFELGGDSLHVFQITARAKKAGLSVTPKQILQRRTIAAVMADVAASTDAQPAKQAPAIVPIARERFRIQGGLG